MKTGQVKRHFFAAQALALIITFISFLVYIPNYQNPNKLFWDENYHIASAQKYLSGTFFMEPHPPLGKLLIALGEKILAPNLATNQFIGTSYIRDLPEDFSMAGYRLVPTILGWLSAPLFFLCLYLIIGNPLWAAILSSAYIFDNALVLHSRSAMLDSTLIFFMLLSLLSFLLLARNENTKRRFWLYSLLFGFSFAATICTKATGLILFLLIPSLVIKFWPDIRRTLTFLFLSGISFLITFIVIWQIHFSIATTPVTELENKGFFKASEEYKELLKTGTGFTPSNFYVMIQDHLKFSSHYQAGVPKLNLCKDVENGSPFYLWPIGARSINYRWREVSKDKFQYLFLQSNPAVWLPAFLGVLLASSLFITSVTTSSNLQLKNRYYLTVFLALYFGYMGVMANIDRVMYLYHYFIPLLFSFFLCALSITQLTRISILPFSDRSKTVTLVAWLFVAIASFRAYSPLTYYKEISNESLNKLAIFRLWDLHCPKCPKTNHFAFPVEKKRTDPKKYRQLVLGGISPYAANQDWGEPQIGKSAAEKPVVVKGVAYQNVFGVHAISSLYYKLNKRFEALTGQVALPDYLADSNAKVTFEVWADGKLLWRSQPVIPLQDPEQFSVSLKDSEELELRVTDGGNSIDNDHACWLNLEMR